MLAHKQNLKFNAGRHNPRDLFWVRQRLSYEYVVSVCNGKKNYVCTNSRNLALEVIRQHLPSLGKESRTKLRPHFQNLIERVKYIGTVTFRWPLTNLVKPGDQITQHDRNERSFSASGDMTKLCERIISLLFLRVLWKTTTYQ